MSDDPFEIFLQFLRDKKTAIKNVSDDVQRLTTLNRGVSTFLDDIDGPNFDEEIMRKKLKTLMRVIKLQNTIMSKMMVLMLAYIQGSNFDQDVANMLDKLGRGEEALNAMLDAKSKGR